MKLQSMAIRAALAMAIVVGGAALNKAQEVEPKADAAFEVQMRKMRVQADHAAKQAAEAAEQAAKFKFKFQEANWGGGSQPLEMGIREAAAKVRDAQDDAARTEATAELTKLLDEYFEADVKNREQELADVAARLQKLQQQLDRRRAKKQEIIDLQVKVALNEADGLGFYGQPRDSVFEVRVPTPVKVPVSVDSGNRYGAPVPPTPPFGIK